MYKELSEEDSNNSINVCALCDISLSRFPVVDAGRVFCCTGCHAVFTILSSKNQLDNFQDSHVFQKALEAGLISNPALLEQIHQQKLSLSKEPTEKLNLEIGEMWCPSCAEVIRLILMQQKGVLNCVIDYTTDLAAIEYSPRYLSADKIRETITSLGYHPISLENLFRKKLDLNLYIRFGIAAFCALNAMMFSYPLYATYFDPEAHEDGKIFAWLTFACSLPVVTYCMWPILKRGWNAFRLGLLGMEALVITGVTAAFGLSIYELLQGSNLVYFDSMSVIVAFVLLGKMIETKAKFSAKESLFRLTKSIPRRGRKRLVDGTSEFVSTKAIIVGDLLIAHTGEKIVMDGEVVEGDGSVDESMMTGEFLPINKRIGSKLLGGTVLKQGSLIYKVSSLIEESALNRIIQTVEQDIGHKSTYVRAADPIIRWFVPSIFIVAFFTWLGSWFFGYDSPTLRAVSVLLIACPCAIGIAAPLAESQLIQKLTLLGVIVKNRGCLSLIPSITTFIFDKTGTLTEGAFSILDGLQSINCSHQSALKALASKSHHLVSKAIYNAVEVGEEKLENVTEFPGKGMLGYREGQICLLGSKQLFEEQNIFIPDEEKIERAGVSSIVYFSPNYGKNIYKIFLGDTLRMEAPSVVKEINSQCSVVLLSGDSSSPVESVARACGIKQFFSQYNPLKKREYIENLRSKNEIVCMVGDGINDAPALTAAQIGISVLSASDISIQVSDILLTTERLDILPKMLKIVKRGDAIVRENLFWAFFYNIIGIGLAIVGLLSPIFAAIAMTVSSLMVLFNSKRV